MNRWPPLRRPPRGGRRRPDPPRPDPPRPAGAPPRSALRELAELPNLGPTSAAWLLQAGVGSVRELAALGPVEAFFRVRAQQPDGGVTLTLLYALFAALHGLRWHALPEEAKRALRAQLNDLERDQGERDPKERDRGGASPRGRAGGRESAPGRR